MSGESIAGVGVVGAAGGVVILGAAAAAGCAYVGYQVGKAAGAGTALAVGASMSAIGRHLEHQQEHREALHAERVGWEAAIRDVATRNARIGALQAILQAADDALQSDGELPASEGHELATVEVPAPIVLGAQSLAELIRWCALTDTALAVVESEVVDRSTQALLRRAMIGVDLTELTGADVVLPDGPTSGTAAADSRGAGASARGWDREPVLADLARIVARLSVDVGADERASVTAAVARVLRAPSRTDARNRLGDVRVRLDQANAVATERRSHAVQAASLLQPLARVGAAADDVRTALLEVVAGRRALTPDLPEQAGRFAQAVQHEADRIYLRQSVTESLAELGYAVDAGFQTAIPKDGMLQVKRSEWSAHGVRMMLDEDKRELRAVVVRTEADTGWDEGRVDVEREKQWCGDLDKLAASLAEKGIDYQIRLRSEAGTKELPVVLVAPRAESGQTRAPRQVTRQLGSESS